MNSWLPCFPVPTWWALWKHPDQLEGRTVTLRSNLAPEDGLSPHTSVVLTASPRRHEVDLKCALELREKAALFPVLRASVTWNDHELGAAEVSQHFILTLLSAFVFSQCGYMCIEYVPSASTDCLLQCRTTGDDLPLRLRLLLYIFCSLSRRTCSGTSFIAINTHFAKDRCAQ